MHRLRHENLLLYWGVALACRVPSIQVMLLASILQVLDLMHGDHACITLSTSPAICRWAVFYVDLGSGQEERVTGPNFPELMTPAASPSSEWVAVAMRYPGAYRSELSTTFCITVAPLFCSGAECCV